LEIKFETRYFVSYKFILAAIYAGNAES